MSRPSPTIRFTNKALDAFARMSHDVNPLHRDAAYARRTPFGTPVVYGMLGALAALKPLLEQGPVRLRTVRCSFPGPLLPDTTYTIAREGLQPGEVKLQLLSGGVSKVDVVASFEESPAHVQLPVASGAPVAEPAFEDPATLAGRELVGLYGIDTNAASVLDAELRLHLRNLPLPQLQTFAWVSYSCGMLVPGRQSLIATVQLQFPDEAAGGPLSYVLRVENFDARFGSLRLRHVLRAEGRLVAEATITAFSRPQPVSFSLDALHQNVEQSNLLRGRVALVTGGARGLGAYLAGALVRSGADVVIDYRSDHAEANAVADALRSGGGTVHVVRADASSPEEIAHLAQFVTQSVGRLDILVNNASPPIQALTFEELGDNGLSDFVTQSLNAVALPTRAFLTLLRGAPEGGTVVTISSEYAATTPAKFSHYAAAKLAIEGVMQSLAREERDIRFIVARPPKLLTDQTNTNFDLGARLHPAKAAARIIESVHAPAGERYHLLARF